MQSHEVHNEGFGEVYLAAVCKGVSLFLLSVFFGLVSKCCRVVTEVMLFVGLSVAGTYILSVSSLLTIRLL